MNAKKHKPVFLIAQYFLNHKLDTELVREHMREFAAKGYEGVFAHARAGLLTPYMSQAWWDTVSEIMESCKKLNMQFWIWDEDYYPSGLAGGRIVWENPGLVSKSLKFKTEIFENRSEIELDFEEGTLLRAYAIEIGKKRKCAEPVDISKHCGTRRQKWIKRNIRYASYSPFVTMAPHWRSRFTENRFALYWKPPQKAKYLITGITACAGKGVHPDFLNPASTEKFIEITHRQYYERYKKEFGHTIMGLFTDEPGPDCEMYPWTESFPEEFRKEHGYDIMENLAHLAWDINEKSYSVRYHFRETQHRLMSENYLGQIKKWCHTRKIDLTGHLPRSDWFSLTAIRWPNELRCYSHMDIPCSDPLGETYGQHNTIAYHSGLKVVSSVAHIFNKKQAGSDCPAVMGDKTCIRDLKAMIDYHLVMGINFFAIHGFSYSTDGPRKDEVPPPLFYQHSEWEYMGAYTAYIREMSDKLSGGKHICKILMLYPSFSLSTQMAPSHEWMKMQDEEKLHELVDMMLSCQKDFDFIDEVTLSESIDSKGKIELEEDYELIILPYMKFIGENAVEALKRYSKNGGKVILTGSIPEVIPVDIRQKVQCMPSENMSFIRKIKISKINTLFPSVTNVKGKYSENIFTMAYHKNDAKYVFAFNRGQNHFSGNIDDTPVSIPARSGKLTESNCKVYQGNKKSIPCGTLDNDWEIEFGQNSLPMNLWHIIETDNARERNIAITPATKHFDFLDRENEVVFVSEKPKIYRYCFMSSGNIDKLKIVIEESSFKGKWQLFVNDIKITKWKREAIYDCKNITAKINHALEKKSTPALNTVEFVCEAGTENGLLEMPYLYGTFKCGFPHGSKSMPEVSETEKKLKISTLSDWRNLGYPCYSGAAVYTKIFELEKSGRYVFDLGKVEDIAEIEIDNTKKQIIAWPPYVYEIHLKPGIHSIKIKVVNGPGNRYRNVGRPAGLLGPLSIMKKI